MIFRNCKKLEKDTRSQQAEDLFNSLKNVADEVSLIRANLVKPDGYSLRRAPRPEEVETLTNKVSALSLSKRKFAAEEAILAGLDFEQRPHRHEAIPAAYQDTFQWILKPPLAGEPSTHAGFRSWLETGDGIFWTSGKPGSGKSTLVKFIQSSQLTTQCLSNWAGAKRVVTTGFYFWSAGSAIQKTREGLLRSLLYGILRQAPELIPQVCVSHWQTVQSSVPGAKERRWTMADLEGALHRLSTMGELPAKFCIFVDGVDEYEGDSIALARELVSLSAVKDIKLCVSSRPWNVFQVSFGADPLRKLFIHDLTRKDMESYVTGRLVEHPRWGTVASDLGQGRSITAEIVERAEGVFLWVYLVTQMLREGLSNYDSLGDLWKRLESLPTDLNTFFHHILSSVEPFYYQKLLGSLLISLAARSPLSVEIYSFHELEYDDEEYAIRTPVQAMDRQEAQDFHEPTPWRLNGWTKGLLEVRHGYVEFLHRTVRDFLRTEQMTAFLREKRAVEHFNPPLSILRAHVSWIKRTQFGDNEIINPTRCCSGTIRNLLDRSLRHSSAINFGNDNLCDSFELLLDNLELSLVKMVQSGQLCSSSYDTKTIESHIMVLYRYFLIVCDLGSYISRKLAQNSNYLDKYIESPLELTLTSFISDTRGWIVSGFTPSAEPRCENVLRSLLQHGYDPNGGISSDLDNADTGPAQTPWVSFIAQFFGELVVGERNFHAGAPHDAQEPDLCFQAIKTGVFSVLLQHGADSNAGVDLSSFLKEHNDTASQGNQPFWFAWVLLAFKLPDLWRHRAQYLEATKFMFESDVDITLIMPAGGKDNFQKVGKAWMPHGLQILCNAISLLLRQEALKPKRIQFIGVVVAELAKAIGKTGRFHQELAQLLKDIAPRMQPALLKELRGSLPASSFPDLEKGMGGVKRGPSSWSPGDESNRMGKKRVKRGGN